jgi:hypothetical protein
VVPAARCTQARLISRFHDLYLEPALRRLYGEVPPATRDARAVAAASQAFVQHLRVLEHHLLARSAAFAAGDDLGLANCAYPGLFLYAQLLWPALGLGELRFGDLGLRRVAAWDAALTGHASVATVLRELRPAAEAWLASKLGAPSERGGG